jgi:ubiquinone/menaquinone biosynthesis C-methylase UbiE
MAAEPLAGEGAILDIGCGGGWLLGELAGARVDPGRLHGVDLIAERVAAASERVPGTDLRRADARKLPFEDRTMALVTFLTCLSSMPGRAAMREALSEARRVLRPGGLLLCYEPRLPNPFNRATRLVSRRDLRAVVGEEADSIALTGFPPLARHLRSPALRSYGVLSALAPTHRLTAHRQGQGMIETVS